MNRIYVFLLGMLLLTACKTYSEDDKGMFDSKIEAYLKKNKLSYERSESGLYYLIEEPGEGKNIQYSDVVTFTYEGRLLDGSTFDDRYREEPVEFAVSDLILGWKEIMLYLKKGGKAKLVVPPQLGYGDHELEDIPKNSILLFDLEVKEVR